MRFLVFIFLCIFGVSPLLAAETPLAMNDAFKFSVDRAPSEAIHLHWQMPPGYYLYRQYLSAKTADGAFVPLVTFPGTEKIDPNFGKSEVYFDRAEAELGPVGSSVTVTYQGCQEHGLCYPPARRIIDPTTLAVSEQPVFSPPTGRQSAWSDTATTDSATGTQGSTQLTTIVASANEEDIVGGFLSRDGVPLLLGAFIGFGILLALLNGFGSVRTAARVDPEDQMAVLSSMSQLTAQLDAARSSGRASLVYFTADWCVSCRSIDRNVFSSPDVANALAPLKTFKVDLTNISPEQRELMRELDVVGPPTMIFLSSDRRQTGKRLVGEFGTDEVLKAAAVIGNGA